MKPIQVLGICGSPRKGNSLFLLDQALEACRLVDPQLVVSTTWTFKAKTMKPCIACSYCAKHTGQCVHKDDFEELKAQWLAADVIVYSVPVYHMGLPGQLKCFIDRLGNSCFGTYAAQMPPGVESLPKLLKVIGSIAQGVHIFSGQEHAITQLINHALVMQSIPVAGDLWEAYIGAGGWTVRDEDVDAMRDLVANGEAAAAAVIRASRAVGRRCVEMAMIIRAGLQANTAHFSSDPLYGPVYKREESGT